MLERDSTIIAMPSQEPSPPPTLLESSDAARLLGVTAQQVRMLSRLGALAPCYQTPRGVRLYKSEDVLRLVAERRREGRK